MQAATPHQSSTLDVTGPGDIQNKHTTSQVNVSGPNATPMQASSPASDPHRLGKGDPGQASAKELLRESTKHQMTLFLSNNSQNDSTVFLGGRRSVPARQGN